ncbi:hypothetical protein KKF05_01735 [Patescibacteria group bacterium]|nr:hypothetical protein [Patescibacteria group bacterium]MBU1029294.1 hypothetical protein [Patescibacteria group bacterium]
MTSPKKILTTVLTSLVLASYPLAGGASLRGAREGLQSAGSAAYGGEAEAGGAAQVPIIIGSIINAALGLLGVILVVLLIYGGFLWMTAGGNTENVDKAKKLITNAIIGIIIVLAAYSISYFVLQRILTATGVVADPTL